MTTTSTGITQDRTALVLHGGGGPRTVAPLVAHLASAFRVVAPTHPGWDGTERPAAIASIHALAVAYLKQLREDGEQDVVLVGSSIGGWIALEMAITAASEERFAGIVGAVVDIDGVGAVVDGAPIADFFSLSPRQLAEAAWHDPDRGYVDPMSLTDEQRAVQQSNGATMAVVAGRSMSEPDLLARLGHLDVPVLVVFGESDRIVTPEYGRAVAAAIPAAEFVVVPGAGHLPHLEAPDATWARIDPFLARH
ncbi:pimeloyl-ACP methyl ester carboxylesterase [Curtobacterium luteum]|uniref:Alpha/beta hydrolase n=1 Tax=Curtobacterium luteum TaxID=33881 RepID=A0A8H9L1W7_9MICO|nr:alpha/beta hydrolase [Curtobacterium luteum]MBM7804061.1 pimeloyl-ACP methyl ester carboxylesterase [Curtobacterium luteum]NUU49838.1 alpha/beta hydrolase [Curtobacterium luteum]GGK97412.1 alpha/beta hydrolase [Curtobacterium luteum]